MPKCHKPGGDAEDCKLILKDPTREPAVAMEHIAPSSPGWRNNNDADQMKLIPEFLDQGPVELNRGLMSPGGQ